ncbi:FGGY family carbohydrate kinase [Kribbella sindirgiensis]|uniref:ATP:glycerol 3-phosphotransferase n=1 Tax=Kribbella sindirgiensis TaxID=1124744 RepID=A0A4R0I7X6_9ACTN|nr:FGGY family carbohydrate kinase [Kribbella sindirgiensis]TCC23270.1 glycerol kinase [Kribbella sindirgiensis]
MVQAVLAIDQGTTNSKAALVTAGGDLLATGSAPVGLSTPHPGWVEQDPENLWQSVLHAISTATSFEGGRVEVVGIALSTQRESVVGWNRSGEPVGPVLGWQDVRTAEWCAQLPSYVDDLVRRRTGLRVDAMFSAPKMRWLLDRSDAYVGTVDAWLIHRLTGCQEHLTEAGNASRTLLYDTVALDWSPELLEAFDIPRAALPDVRPSNAGFGVTKDVPGLADGIPIVAVLADSHAAMYGQGCTQAGTAKATYGTGSSVMTPIAGFEPSGCTLAWLTDRPMYALEGNIVSSGAALAWTANLLGLPDVGALTTLAATVESAEDVVLVPAFAGLGAPHWDREARAALTGMSSSTTRAHIARAAVDAVAHQICDITDTIPGTLSSLRADGGATVSGLLMQTQADLLGHPVEAADVPEISALGVAELAWTTLGETTDWAGKRSFRTFDPGIDAGDRDRRRAEWAQAVASVRVRPA